MLFDQFSWTSQLEPLEGSAAGRAAQVLRIDGPVAA
jgi:hypothetical protein